jgi:hypothetical protein
MPVRTIAETNACYYLICFDENGVERREPDGSMLSQTVARLIGDLVEGITDAFFASHGWKGDVPAAIEQYDRWVGEMVRSPDHAAVIAARPEFKAIVVGLHWPSLPFGDENITREGGVLSDENDEGLERQIDQYAASIGDTPTARTAIRTILEAAQRDDGERDALPEEVRDAYDKLFAEAFTGDIWSGTLGAPPGADHGDWDPDSIYRDARKAEASESTAGGPGLLGGGLLERLKGLFVVPLQQLSFWKMKDRARRIGESGGRSLLRDLQSAARPGTHFHLMGHSFGCIVVSAAVAGAPGGATLSRAVDSLFLVQGALSLWSFCSDIPYAPGEAGYFSRILNDGLVQGPILTTRSKHDSAVRKLYPYAAGVAGQFVLNEDLPKYGGVGTFGAQGLGALAEDRVMQSPTVAYGFKRGRVYNLEASGTIKNGGGFSGAHSDFVHPEVAHAMWQAVLAQM